MVNKGLYAACSAMLVQETCLDVVTNNLANVDTSGYKKRVSASADFSAYMDRIEKVSEDGETKIMTLEPFTMNWRGRQTIGTMALGNIYSESVMDSSPGIVKTTDNPLEVVIDNKDGFFSVQDDAGNVYYTRAGNFTLNNAGMIVTQGGYLLTGDGGGIEVGQAQNVTITKTGQVIADGQAVGNITVFTFENPTYLRQVSRNLLAPTEQSGEATELEGARVTSGAVEQSNVSVVEEMTRMTEVHRAYEAASKALVGNDELTTKLISTYSR